MQLPGEQGQEFVLMRPYMPRGKPNQLSAFMVARNDGEQLRQARLVRGTDTRIAPSPAQAATLIESDRVDQRDSSRCSTSADPR